jgi:hypothetical protein
MDRKIIHLVDDDTCAIKIAADSPAFNQQPSTDHSATQGDGSAGLDPVGIEARHDRAIQDEAIDNCGTQDRGCVEPTFLQSDIAGNAASF